MTLSIDEMRAKVVAHDQAEAEARRAEALKPIQPVLDGVAALDEAVTSLQALHTPDLLQADQDLWERLRVWLQITQSLQSGVKRSEAAITTPIAVPLTANTSAE